MNSPDMQYPQPFIQTAGGKRRFVTLEIMSSLICKFAIESGQAKSDMKDPVASGQPLAWLEKDSIGSHDIADMKLWQMQDWMLTKKQQTAYDQRKQDSSSDNDGDAY